MNFRDFFSTRAWWGKVIGGFFGYLAGGPIGAFFGILLGNFFDRGFSSYYNSPHWLYHAETQKEVQKIFFESTFLVMGLMAKADGRVSEKEIDVAKTFMEELRLNSAQKELAKRLFNTGKQPSFNMYPVLAKFKAVCRGNTELLKLFIDIQYRAAQADTFNTNKMTLMNNILTQLGFAPLHHQYRFYEDFDYSQAKQQSSYQQSSSSYQNSYSSPLKSKLDHAFALLEVPLNSNKQEVKRAYRKLLSKNHPDKLIAQGLPQEMIKIANEKTQKIVKAYELICESKGW